MCNGVGAEGGVEFAVTCVTSMGKTEEVVMCSLHQSAVRLYGTLCPNSTSRQQFGTLKPLAVDNFAFVFIRVFVLF